MTIGAKLLASLVRDGNEGDVNGLVVIPPPDIDAIRRSGEASVTLRLGRWFLSMRQSNVTHISTYKTTSDVGEARIGKKHFVPFGSDFVVHPGRFVLASTLEWIRIPAHLTAYVVGKSSLGRRGIIIETAAGVHPGFSGCLTLEIANVGEVPVQLTPGMNICQIFLHRVEGETSEAKTKFSGRRRPAIGALSADPVLKRLQRD
ncbi:dCTP deaminase [Terrarubrum flagellatum]|uniref:dCTP deaminase n=1 Tax=Terrirubrum flagellatum TaxID=2895980 RepID=UPI003144E494